METAVLMLLILSRLTWADAMRVSKHLLLYVMVFVLCAVTVGSPSSGKTLNVPLDTLSHYFRLPEEQGWLQMQDGFHTFDTTRLYDLIDGGAVIYNKHGLQHGIYQRMKHKDGRMYDAMIMDLISPDKALSLYLEQVKQTGANLTIDGFDSSEVCASDVLSGICVYAHFNGLYFELTVTGYKDQAGATKDAIEFLALFRSRSNSICKSQQ